MQTVFLSKKTLSYFVSVVAALAAFASSVAAGQARERSSEVEVMILGVYHFSSPGADVINTEVDDFLHPRRQRELANLAQALAQWRPTRIVVEDSVIIRNSPL